jgi:hypothetical protein
MNAYVQQQHKNSELQIAKNSTSWIAVVSSTSSLMSVNQSVNTGCRNGLIFMMLGGMVMPGKITLVSVHKKPELALSSGFLANSLAN